MAAERVFFDTSLLVAASIEPHPGHEAARAYFARAATEGVVGCLSPQVCREFMTVLTRQPVSGVTFTIADALDALDVWMANALLLEETEAVVSRWRELVVRYQVRGKQVHDCNIVAVMLTHGVRRLATRNAADFDRYEEGLSIEPVVP